MSGTATAASIAPIAAPAGRSRAGTVALVAAAGVATAGIAARGGSPLLAAAPVLVLALVWTLSVLPLRWSTTALLALTLTLDLSDDAQGEWHSPLAVLGDLLRDDLDRFVPIRGLKVSGSEALVLLLVAVGIWRRATGDDRDTRGAEPMAGVLRGAFAVFLAGVAYATVVGLATGGNPAWAIIQVRPLLHLAVFALLFHLAYRGARDHLTLARLTLATATAKAGLAWWVDRYVAPHTLMRKWEFSTNHGDSILFSMAAIIVLVHLLERPDRPRLLRAAIFVPVALLGVIHNHRRLAWIDLAAALACVYVVSPWRGWKRIATRATLLATPVLVAYVAVGWQLPHSRIFAPVRIARTVSDPSIDRSTLYRAIENWNQAMSIAESPILGRGFGHGFSEFIKGDDISTIFKLYRLEPHNAVLGLLLFGGLPGFFAIWSLLAVGIFLAARAHRFAVLPEDRAAALSALAVVVICVLQTYGDMGQYSQQYPIYLALALTVAGRLAVRTGAWPGAAPAARGDLALGGSAG